MSEPSVNDYYLEPKEHTAEVPPSVEGEPWEDKSSYWWVLASNANGQVLATSETYTTKSKRTKTMLRLAKATGISIRYKA